MRLSAAVIALMTAFSVAASAATISRQTKDGSGTADWITGTIILPDEINTEMNTIFNEINGNLDNANIDASAAIAYSKLNLSLSILNGDIAAAALIDTTKLDDRSSSLANQASTSDPGPSSEDSSTLTLATDLEDEILQLRHKVEQLTVGTSAGYTAGSAGATARASWIDGPLRPGNLIYNGGFDAWQKADCTACTDPLEGGWAVVQTPNLADTALTETDGAGGGMGMLVTGNGAALEGIKQTIDGLKAGTRYLALASVKPTTGDSCRMLTTGADTNQLTIDSAADNAFEVIGGTFQTDATPADVVLQLLAVADGDVCLFDHVGVYEINTDPAPRPGIVHVIAENTTASGDVADTLTTVSGLTVTVTPPMPGCLVQVTAHVQVEKDLVAPDTTDGDERYLECAIDENGTDVAHDRKSYKDDPVESYMLEEKESSWVHYTNANPTPGTALLYSMQCTDLDPSYADEWDFECDDGARDCFIEATMFCGL